MERSSEEELESALGSIPPLKITVAPNGARRNKADHPQLPINLREITDCAEACWNAGAHEIHLHVREDDGTHSLSSTRYQRTIDAITERVPDMSVQITTESAGRYEVSEQFQLLKSLRPAAASIAVRESLRDTALVARLYGFAEESQIKVQHILYDLDDLAQLRRQYDAGTIPDHMRDVLLVFGTYAPPRLAEVSEVEPFIKALGSEFPNWTVCAFGKHENAVAAEAMRLGGHIRIGFENNIQRPDGNMAVDNAENIARALKTAQSLNRTLQKRSH